MFSTAEAVRPVSGQITCGFEKTPATEVLARLNPGKLDLALKIRPLGSRLPGYVKLHSLTLWQPGARANFLDAVQAFGEARATEARVAVNSLSETLFDEMMVSPGGNLTRAIRHSLRGYEDRLAQYGAPIDPTMVEPAPERWADLLLSLPAEQRKVVEQAIGTVDPSCYFLDSRALITTVADLRAANPTAIDLEKRALSDNATVVYLRDHNRETGLFRAVAFGNGAFQS
jgi:hypothetical protein